MLPFAHMGITFGAAWLLKGGLSRQRAATNVVGGHAAEVSPEPASKNRARFDYRWVLVGSILPDIIDKPIGVYLFRDTFNSGRIFCHSLLFLILISLGGLYLYKWRKRLWLLLLAFGSGIHLILDLMWQEPESLLWPFYGWSFAEAELENWISGIVQTFRSDPAVYVPEIVGGAILVLALAVLVWRRRVYAFFRYGQY